MQPHWEPAGHQLFECRSGSSSADGVEVLIDGHVNTKVLMAAIRWAARTEHIPKTARFILMNLPARCDLLELKEIAECTERAGLSGRLCLVCSLEGVPYQHTMAELQQLGIRVALGGVGPQCRLADLIERPLDGFVFDRDFVDATAGEPRAACALDALVNLAKNLGIKTFASRVTLAAAFDAASAAGIDYVTVSDDALFPSARSHLPSPRRADNLQGSFHKSDRNSR